EPAAAVLEVAHQPGQVEAVVDGAGRGHEIPAEGQRGRGAEGVVVADEAGLPGGPVVPARLPLALQRRVVVADRVEQPARGQFVPGLVRVDGDRDVMLAQQQAQVQTGHPGADDADAGHCDSLLYYRADSSLSEPWI